MRTRNVPFPSFSLVLTQELSNTRNSLYPRSTSRDSGLHPPSFRFVDDGLMRTVDDRISGSKGTKEHFAGAGSLPTIYEQDEASAIDAALNSGKPHHRVRRKRRISLTEAVIDLALVVVRRFLH